MFDLRDKEHSTIIYECPFPDSPLLRLGWNKQDPRYMATLMMDSTKVRPPPASRPSGAACSAALRRLLARRGG